jgi:hypothetical protein
LSVRKPLVVPDDPAVAARQSRQNRLWVRSRNTPQLSVRVDKCGGLKSEGLGNGIVLASV